MAVDIVMWHAHAARLPVKARPHGGQSADVELFYRLLSGVMAWPGHGAGQAHGGVARRLFLSFCVMWCSQQSHMLAGVFVTGPGRAKPVLGGCVSAAWGQTWWASPLGTEAKKQKGGQAQKIDDELFGQEGGEEP